VRACVRARVRGVAWRGRFAALQKRRAGGGGRAVTTAADFNDAGFDVVEDDGGGDDDDDDSDIITRVVGRSNCGIRCRWALKPLSLLDVAVLPMFAASIVYLAAQGCVVIRLFYDVSLLKSVDLFYNFHVLLVRLIFMISILRSICFMIFIFRRGGICRKVNENQ
jgi:hypothetical protein